MYLEPSVPTSQTLLLLLVYGERSHQMAAELPLYAIRLLLPLELLPKYASLTPSFGK